MSNFYTDREYGARPPSIDTIDERLWAGLYSLIQTRIGDGSFGLRFPEQCPDGYTLYLATDGPLTIAATLHPPLALQLEARFCTDLDNGRGLSDPALEPKIARDRSE